MDKELKEFTQWSQYYNDIDWDKVSDKQKERVKDTLHFHFWKLSKEFGLLKKELKQALYDQRYALLVVWGTVILVAYLLS